MSLITPEQLKKIFKSAKEDKINLYCEAFNKVFPQYDINTPQRIAAFLGQIAVESGELDTQLESMGLKLREGFNK